MDLLKKPWMITGWKIWIFVRKDIKIPLALPPTSHYACIHKNKIPNRDHHTNMRLLESAEFTLSLGRDDVSMGHACGRERGNDIMWWLVGLGRGGRF
ncbi:hypothetical protein Pmani_010717 [Petrolisthes manimaculis]|uniref:Uncharacterized protein n=1 Tax=Petrolisthes manimaculis TaxID=1843537 RepID=A0AAE1Q1N9_9EUCA|nr:hypothetical protein Pmani_010717 [Petrolisthes manimaculis]